MGKMLVLSKYGQRAASTRYRFTQYFPALREAGYQCELSPLLDDDYLTGRFAGRLPLASLVRAGIRRWRDLLRAGDFNVVALNYEAFPYLPAIYERVLATQAPIVFDIDDAIFHRYDLRPWLRPFLGRKIARIARLSRVAIAGNDYLAEHLQFGKNDVRVIPTVVDTTLYRPVPARAGAVPVIGWIGSPSTGEYLEAVVPAIREACAGGRARFVVVGAGKKPFLAGAENREWAEEREIPDVQSFDIGVMPLPDDPWSRGKCGFKLIQYMACGLPVVASPVGVNTKIVKPGETGFLCSTNEEWAKALKELVASEELRKKLGAAGRASAEADWSLQRWSWSFVRAVSDATRF